MFTDAAASYPEQGRIRSLIDEACARSVYLDARGLAEALFGDDQHANVLMLGAAYQSGAIGLPVAAIERAIVLNGVAVERNLQAFRRGRQFVADQAGLNAAVAAPIQPVTGGHGQPGAARVRSLVDAAPGTELARLLDIRVPDLIGYQGEDYARSYAEFVERVRELEDRLAGATVVTEEVARNLYKLMAYKDEYEVARLCLDEGLAERIEARFGAGARYSYRLHPPLLRALGMKRKISLGRWARPVLALLRAMRRLRGTRFDPFGYTAVRRAERALIPEYRDAVWSALSAAGPGDHAVAAELAALPGMIRGYERIKLASVARYRERQAELLAEPGPAKEAAA
jgi:indolepyruvate ferredoxin oxidoreductase